MKPTTLDKILRKPELCEVTGYGSSQVDELIEHDPDFPKPLKLSKDGRAIGFLSSEVAAYQAKRIAERDRELLRKAKQQPRAAVVAKKAVK